MIKKYTELLPWCVWLCCENLWFESHKQSKKSNILFHSITVQKFLILFWMKAPAFATWKCPNIRLRNIETQLNLDFSQIANPLFQKSLWLWLLKLRLRVWLDWRFKLRLLLEYGKYILPNVKMAWLRLVGVVAHRNSPAFHT